MHQALAIGRAVGGGAVETIAGTAGQIVVTPATGDVVISLDNPLLPPGRVRGIDGTAASPTYSYASSTNTGLYLVSSGLMAFASGGVAQFAWNAGGVMSGFNGQTLTMPSTGSISLAANGTNQSITLTPSGTAAVQIGAASSFTFAAGYGELAITGTSGGLIDFERTAATAQKWRVGSGIAGGSEWSVRDVTGGASPIVCPVGTGHLLLAGLTTDGTGVLQLPAATTSAGGITFGTDLNIFRISGDTLGINGSSAFNVQFQTAGTTRLSLASSGASAIIQANTGGGLIFNTNSGNAALTLDSSQNATFAKKITSYNGVATTGWGVPSIVATGRFTAQSAAGNITNGAYTVGAADGTFQVSGNINIISAIGVSTSLNVAYTDETNTARTMILPLSGLAGSFVAAGLATTTGPFESAVMHIRCKASTTITFSVAAGTFTSVSYNAECTIKQTA